MPAIRKSAVGLGLAGALTLVAGAAAPAAAPRDREDARLLKEAVISAATLVAVMPQLDADARTSLAITRILLTVQVFERLSEQRDLEVLATLAPYNLGASGGEVFSCVVLGKGPKIRAALARQIESRRNECTERAAGSKPPIPDTLCLDEKVLREHLEWLLKHIDAGNNCEQGRRLD